MKSSSLSPARPSLTPHFTTVTRGMSPRKSIITRLSQFSKPVSVMPYAPERLSITQSALDPETMKMLADKGAKQEETAGREQNSVTTLFAALQLRRMLHRVQAEHEQSGPRVIKNETKANLERHLKVLARYKIRQVDTEANEARQLRHLPPFMMNPHSNLYKMWQLVTLVTIIYQSIMLPFTLAFGSNDTTFVDILMSSIFALDIVVAFNTPLAVDIDETAYITDRRHIASNYLSGWFFFDLLACLPFDYVLLLATNSKSSLSVLGLLKALRVPRLLRLVRLLRLAKLFKMRPELRRWLQYSRHANLLRLARLVVSFLVINHYVACFWYGVVMSERTRARAQDLSTDSLHLYIVAFYQSLLVVMGQNIAVYEDTEIIFCIFAMVVGAVLMAVVFGNVAILIANYYESQSSYQKKMEWLFASMNRMKLPHDLQNRINAYYQAMWERHGTLDGAVAAFIPELSRNLAYEVELFLRMDMINQVPIFQNCSAKVVQELVMELEMQVFMPGDYIVVRGEVGNDMYFVQSGVCEVTKDVNEPSIPAPRHSRFSQAFQPAPHSKTTQATSDSSPSQLPQQAAPVTKEILLKVLGQGDYFGEIALLINCKRTANVRARVFSELCTLTREVFESISQRYLEDRNIIEAFIMDKYDPSMLQAAMKQSQEVSMRSSGFAAVASAVATKANATAPKPSTSSPSRTMSSEAATLRGEAAMVKITELVTQVLQRIDHLEQQIAKEAETRRESEANLGLNGATKQLPSLACSLSDSLLNTRLSAQKHWEAPKRSIEAVADDSEGTPQRQPKIVNDVAEMSEGIRAAAPSVVDEEVVGSTSKTSIESDSMIDQSSLTALSKWRDLQSEKTRMRLRKSRTGQSVYPAGIGGGVRSAGAGGTFQRGSSSAQRWSTCSVTRPNDMFVDSDLFAPEPKDSVSDEENDDQLLSDVLGNL